MDIQKVAGDSLKNIQVQYGEFVADNLDYAGVSLKICRK